MSQQVRDVVPVRVTVRRDGSAGRPYPSREFVPSVASGQPCRKETKPMTFDAQTVLAVVVFFVPIIIFAAMAIASRRARRDRGF